MRASVVVAACALLAGCEGKVRPSVLSSVDSRTLPQQESWNSEIVLSDSGVVRAIINAGYLRVYEANQKTLLSEGVRVRFFDPDGRPSSVLTSREGAVDERSNDLEAHKDVVVTSSDGTRLTTEELYWSESRQLIHTPAFVRIVSPKERLQGVGMESDQHLRNYRIFRVTGETRAR